MQYNCMTSYISHHNNGYHWSNKSKYHPFLTGQPAAVYRVSELRNLHSSIFHEYKEYIEISLDVYGMTYALASL